MEHSVGAVPDIQETGARSRTISTRQAFLVVLLFAAAVYLGCIFSPPSLMDDVDAVQAQIARNMLSSGDWVTARLDGVAYLEKPPLIYWTIAASYKVFGVHDWSARIPVALSAIGLCWLTAAFGAWAFGRRAGFYAGLCMATCIGLWLFTRVLIPDVMLTFVIALAMWAFLRVLDSEEQHSREWAATFAAALGLGLLLKSLIAVVFPVGAIAVYLLSTRQFFSASAWRRLRPLSGLVIILLIAAPWHILATLRNPPYFSFTMRSVPGEYHGFLWFFFINEQLLRFLNLRYPRDYSTVPRLYFWLFHLIWLFPWSVYFPAVAKLSYKPTDRAGRARLLALCWTGFILVFFTFSTTQEYYSMPCYPALALLLGSAMDQEGPWIRRGNRVLAIIAGLAALAAIGILLAVRNVPSPGDISQALTKQATYRLSLGHMQDLTLDSFAYLRRPLGLAAIAFCVGAIGTLVRRGRRAFIPAALMMVLFFQAARVAMIDFDPYLSSRSLADALERAPSGTLITYRHYYPFSSVFFYTNRSALLLNGRSLNLVYGSYAPDAPNVFIDDAQFRGLWLGPQRYYLAAPEALLPHLSGLVGGEKLIVVVKSGGKVLLTNEPLSTSSAHLGTGRGTTDPLDLETSGSRPLAGS
jgi:4-amino-4-deoxy-L-arabinose transferase-like glycosyltransferase